MPAGESWMRKQLVVVLLAIAILATLPVARAQSADSRDPSSSNLVTPEPDWTYQRPTPKTQFRNYLFDTFGPYPIVGSALAAGINQAQDTPPEWQQGAKGYGERFASSFGIAEVSTTTRYVVAKAFREDTLYYLCECKGVFPRLRHAVISTLVARRGDDGHRVFSFPALVAPYAGTMTAVYAWYPGRYNASDGFRMGNYALLASAGGNIAIEFLYRGTHSWLSRVHLNSGRGTPGPQR